MDSKRIGKAVLDARLAANYSQEDLARRADLASSYISKLERGLIARPSLAALTAVSRALGFTSVDALLGTESPRAIAAHAADGEELTDSELRIANKVADLVMERLLKERAERLARGEAEGEP